jgi:chemotaxis protein methyltransferase CheR
MTGDEHLLLNELITAAIGVSFPEHKREMLECRLRPRLQALRLPTYLDYYFLLQAGSPGEMERLAELVTNNETYFFRETAPFEALFDQALPDLRPGAASPGALRVLLAGCSSGEEAYTLSIVARQHFVQLAGTALTIDAFDVDRSRVEAARRGEYGRISFRATSAEQLERYFLAATPAPAPAPVPAPRPTPAPAPERWAVRPLLRGGVRFFHGNILDAGSFAAPLAYDAVFCRNVLIYFSEPALHRAVDNFAAVLRHGGLLLLGHSESIIGMSPCFATVRLRNLIAYRRTAAAPPADAGGADGAAAAAIRCGAAGAPAAAPAGGGAGRRFPA